MQDAVKGAEGSLGATQLQAILEDFLAAVEASLENGTLQAAKAVPAHIAALHEQRALLATLRSEQDVLQKRLERFEQVCALTTGMSANVDGQQPVAPPDI
jgi:hypothetical protein